VEDRQSTYIMKLKKEKRKKEIMLTMLWAVMFFNFFWVFS
jgi:hypothetical protein